MVQIAGMDFHDEEKDLPKDVCSTCSDVDKDAVFSDSDDDFMP